MKISRLHLERFLGYEDLELVLDERISIFVGPNGAGKSSILDGIRVAFTGTVDGVARKDASQLQHDGRGKPWAVEMVLETDHDDTVCGGGGSVRTIRRTATTLSVMEDGRAVKLNQTNLDGWVRDRAALAALLDVGHALRMTPAERQDLVYRLSGLTVDATTLEARGLRHPAIRDHALRGDWAKAEREAAERKRAAGRELSDLMVVPPQDRDLKLATPTPLSAVDDDMLRRMRAKVSDLETRERELEREIGRLEGRTSASVEGLAERLSEIRAQIAGIEEDDPARGHLTTQDALKVKREERATASRGLLQLRAALDGHVRERDQRLARMDAIDQAGGTHACPICGVEHRGAETDPGEPDRLLAEIEAILPEITALEGRIAKGDAIVAALSADIEALEVQEVAYRAEDARAVKLRTEATGIEQRLATPPVGEGEIADLADTLAQVRESLMRGRAIVREVDQYRQDVTEHETALQRCQTLEADVETYRVMEALCRPGGLRADLLAPVLDPIRDRLASWAPLLDGLEVAVTDDLDVVVSRGGHPQRLSGSETWRVSLALADALAQLSGLRWLCLDEMSLLDPENRRAVTRLLARLEGSYEQVLVCSVLGEVEPRQAPPASGVRVYRVGDGRVVAVVEG